MEVRRRLPSDVPILGAILAETRRHDGYPPHWPAVGEFLVVSRDELDSFVVEEADGAPVGHVALHEGSARSVMDVATSVTGVGADHLAAVARLFVGNGARRTGVGRMLLERASSRAHELGRRPFLDVWEGLPGARALYESAGWKLAGTATIEFRSGCTADCMHEGSSIDSYVFLGPVA